MKFVGNRDKLFGDIASDDGKFARYRGVKLELPSEQYEGAAKFCRDKAQALRQQADTVAQKGKPGVAAKLRREADNYEQLAENVQDSGLTTKDAVFYREHPDLATARDIIKTSHHAGLQGAKYGAVVGGAIATVQNIWALARNEKNIGEAVKDLAVDTSKSAALGYSAGAVGSGIKGVMQQSSKASIRALSKTGLPALVVGTCIAMTGSIKNYVNGKISEAQMLAEIGEKGAGMLSGGMMAGLGQLAIPIPVVGAVIGGMIGHTMASIFYQSALESARRVEASREHLQHVREIETAARARIAQQQEWLNALIRTEIPQLQQATQEFFAALEHTENINSMTAEINRFASLLGKKLEFQTMEEFDGFMNSDRPLTL